MVEIIKPNLKKAVKALKEGKILVCPTDTVYGLICDAGNKEAAGRLYKIKKRPKNKPIPVFVSSIKMAKKTAKVSSRQEKYLKKVWPGAVTVVLQKKHGIGTIGLRISNHRFVLSLAKCIGPLAETSANISGKPASTRIKEVLRQFDGKKYQPDLVIDAGNLKKSRPSQVIDLTVWPSKIIRT